VKALGYPAAYCGYILVRGELVGRYAYPFLDVTRHGYGQVSVAIGRFVALFSGLSLLVIAVDRAAAGLRPPDRGDVAPTPTMEGGHGKDAEAGDPRG
jgi:hypothetical protein